MLTRLRINGFKNLVDVDIAFGPFTCVAGLNGVGKSNLFDAIRFLSALADLPLREAALSTRGEGARTSEIKGLFHRVGDHSATEMQFDAEMLIAAAGIDDLGQGVTAAMTWVRYQLTLALEGQGLHVRREVLSSIPPDEAEKRLRFPHLPVWRDSVVRAERSPATWISTVEQDGVVSIRLHPDIELGVAGRTGRHVAEKLPRTVLSNVGAVESPTAFLVRREMQSWQLLQLEPAALRAPDDYGAPPSITTSGAHLPATLARLAGQLPQAPTDQPPAAAEHAAAVYAQVANRLAELIDGVRSIRVIADDQRELLTLMLTDRANTEHPARSLSDGALRFLALAVLEHAPEAGGLLCLEEPENGIHPRRIPAMLRLLKDLVVDTGEPVGPDNPLRQLIVNTHSPAVVSQVDGEDLLIAVPVPVQAAHRRSTQPAFRWLDGTWRAAGDANEEPIPLGTVLSYLHPQEPAEDVDEYDGERQPRPTRVMDRGDVRTWLSSSDSSRPS